MSIAERIKSLFTAGPTPAELVRDSLQKNKNTPDRLLLEANETVPVFEYGDMQCGMRHHNMLHGEFLCEAYTEQRFYTYVKKDGPSSIPIATSVPVARVARHRVRGELFQVPSKHINNLDNYRENGVQFVRKKVRLILPFLNEEGLGVQNTMAYAYIGKNEAWKASLVWDSEFYRGRGGLFHPSKVYEDRKRIYISQFTHFTQDDFVKPDTSCFIHVTSDYFGRQHANRLSDNIEQKAAHENEAVKQNNKHYEELLRRNVAK